MKRKQEPNFEIMLKSAITAYQEDYETLKKLKKQQIDMTWIGEDGQFCMVDGAKEQKDYLYLCTGRILEGGRRPKYIEKRFLDLKYDPWRQKVFWYLFNIAVEERKIVKK